MINKKHQSLVFAFFMAMLMSCLMSFIINIFNVGFINNTLTVWLKAWGFAFVIAFPTVILISPTISKLVNLVIKED
ncbi:MAG: hypothetical protein COA54_09120 [Thiotrichaceae bacterium]|nr:MAG: hypothetical protein COA54_09120 [Thiotrichaceae bacterium]